MITEELARTKEIARGEWREFLDAFSRVYEGWLVDIQIRDVGGHTETAAENLRLQGITADMKEDVENVITIIVGNALEDSLTHIISDPVHMRIEQTEESADKALEIESSDGTKTVVMFHSPMHPESVNGIV